MVPRWLKGSLATIVVIGVIGLMVAAAPVAGHGVQHALFAHDAGKVDGKSAVGSDASVTTRRGKLVATDATTGRLPNDIIAKAPDADALDGIDSTGFTRGNGTWKRGAIAVAPGTFGAQFFLGFAFDQVAPSPWVGLYYLCPANLANNGSVTIRNDDPDTLNLFFDNGLTEPTYVQVGGNGQYTIATLAAGEHLSIQVQGTGMATFEVYSVHRATDCHAQGQVWFSY